MRRMTAAHVAQGASNALKDSGRLPARLCRLWALGIAACGCFQKLGVLFEGVLITRALLFGIHLWAPRFYKLPCVWDYPWELGSLRAAREIFWNSPAVSF